MPRNADQPDIIPLRSGSPLGLSLFGLFYALLPWLAERFGPDPEGAAMLMRARYFYIAFGILLIIRAVQMHLRRNDRIELDADGVRRVGRKRWGPIAWSEVTDFCIYEGALLRVRLRAGGRGFTLPIRRTADEAVIARLRAGLGRQWQEKLARWAAGTERLPLPTKSYFAFAAATVPLLFYVVSQLVPGMRPYVDPLLGVVLLLISLMWVVFGWGVGYAAGPDELKIGWIRIPLRTTLSITVQSAGGEVWYVQTGRLRTGLTFGVDRAMVYEHITRRCMNAKYQYDIRAPRGPIEAAFYPVPPGAPPELLGASARRPPRSGS